MSGCFLCRAVSQCPSHADRGVNAYMQTRSHTHKHITLHTHTHARTHTHTQSVTVNNTALALGLLQKERKSKIEKITSGSKRRLVMVCIPPCLQASNNGNKTLPGCVKGVLNTSASLLGNPGHYRLQPQAVQHTQRYSS